jgi:hypothetical protein
MPVGRTPYNQSIAFTVAQIEGLLPALDPRQVDKPFIIDGVNFFFNAEGPFSYFGGELVTKNSLNYADNVGSFYVNGQVYYFTPAAVRYFDRAIGQYMDKLDLQLSWLGAEDYPWSSAYVGGKYYFYHPNLLQQVIEFNPRTDEWVLWTSPYFPAGMRYISDALGRLVVLGAVQYSWSALDDGRQFFPDLATGAGFQGLSFIGGTAYAVATIDDGFMVYTSNGVVRASYINDQAVFRHTPLSRKIRILNARCLLNYQNAEHIVLTPQGMFHSTGGQFEDFKPAFNEFYLRELSVTYQDTGRLDYCPQRNAVFVSFRRNPSETSYMISYVVSLALDKWGLFNRDFSTLLLTDAFTDAYEPALGYVDPAGFAYRFVSSAYLEVTDGATITRQPIESYINLGLFRTTDGTRSDQLSQVTDVAIGYGSSAPLDTSVDYTLLAEAVEDWNTLAGNDAYGMNVTARQEFDIAVIGTLDGALEFNSGNVYKRRDTGVQAFYTTQTVGVFFRIRVSAVNEHGSYQINFVELTSNLAGML